MTTTELIRGAAVRAIRGLSDFPTRLSDDLVVKVATMELDEHDKDVKRDQSAAGVDYAVGQLLNIISLLKRDESLEGTYADLRAKREAVKLQREARIVSATEQRAYTLRIHDRNGETILALMGPSTEKLGHAGRVLSAVFDAEMSDELPDIGEEMSLKPVKLEPGTADQPASVSVTDDTDFIHFNLGAGFNEHFFVEASAAAKLIRRHWREIGGSC
ncbi:hypothetical protein GCM10007989_25450 [Devosia pacifica]|uniref:Uncharacterized protein n=1 Tax=Devosia pacifica TaxID=1335967 RepID=A0A918S871_9HYPH|nr:hypothetical protein [Devosia pacifica]GHA28309.1 hypothetical protein GCM10007989_25450 [Devosia pacifica]